MAATTDHSMVLQHLSRSHCNARNPTEARIGPGPREPSSHHAPQLSLLLESGRARARAGTGAEVRACPRPQAEDDPGCSPGREHRSSCHQGKPGLLRQMLLQLFSERYCNCLLCRQHLQPTSTVISTTRHDIILHSISFTSEIVPDILYICPQHFLYQGRFQSHRPNNIINVLSPTPAYKSSPSLSG